MNVFYKRTAERHEAYNMGYLLPCWPLSREAEIKVGLNLLNAFHWRKQKDIHYFTSPEQIYSLFGGFYHQADNWLSYFSLISWILHICLHLPSLICRRKERDTSFLLCTMNGISQESVLFFLLRDSCLRGQSHEGDDSPSLDESKQNVDFIPTLLDFLNFWRGQNLCTFSFCHHFLAIRFDLFCPKQKHSW